MNEFGVSGTAGNVTALQIDHARKRMVEFKDSGFIWQHNGQCVGADYELAKIWDGLGGLIHFHPPINTVKMFDVDYSSWDCRLSTPKPYLERNLDIVLESSLLLALPNTYKEKLRSGTWATVRRARENGVPVILVFPDGSVVYE